VKSEATFHPAKFSSSKINTYFKEAKMVHLLKTLESSINTMHNMHCIFDFGDV
jgi:hypothetical protein